MQRIVTLDPEIKLVPNPPFPPFLRSSVLEAVRFYLSRP
jgi:hypothetical protein